MALAHFPSDEIISNNNAVSINLAFEVIENMTNDHHLDRLGPLVNYIREHWMTRVSPRLFSVYNSNYRTNNSIESFHAQLVGLMGQHAPLWNFYGN